MTPFFTADTHFNHEKMMTYCCRQFNSVEEMNEKLISNWNQVVPTGGLVYHLGDFAWYDPKPILERLNGQIILIKGNHDRDNVSKHPKVVRTEKLLNIRVEDQPVTLCHFAMRVWHLSHYGSWHLYGHSHGKLPEWGKSYDVGVDKNFFFPLSWKEIKDIMQKLPENFNQVKD